MEAPDLELIYVGDPMCSWCWGFAPVLEHLDARFDLPLTVVAGGLRPGDAAQEMDDRLKGYLDQEWRKIEEATGQPFDRATLDRDGWTYDTMTADTAVVTMRAHNPTETLRFFNRVQQAFYAEAVDVTDAGAYPPLLEGFDIDDHHLRRGADIGGNEEAHLAGLRHRPPHGRHRIPHLCCCATATPVTS